MVLQKKVFEYFLCISTLFEPRTPSTGPFWTLGPPFEQLGKVVAMLHIQFQASEPKGSEEDFLSYFSTYFYDFNLGPPGAGPSWTLRPSFGKGTLGNATNQISSIKLNGSEEEDF